MEPANIFSFLAFVSALLFFFLIKNRLTKKKVPPGSLGLPIIGQSLELLKAMREDRGEDWLQQRARKYGTISKLGLFGTPTVFLAGQAYNKFLYTCDENRLSNKQPRSIRMLIGPKSLLDTKGDDHKRLRAAFLSFLKPDALKQYVGKMDQEVRLHLNKYWRNNHQIAVMPLMKTLTFDLICTLLFGVERGGRRDELLRLFLKAMDGMLEVPINLPFTRFNGSLRARSKAGGIIRDLMREKRQKLENKEIPNNQDFITNLLSMSDEAGLPLLSDDEIEDNCALAMIAGHDTSSTVLTYLVKLLAEHPHVHEALLKEQDEIARGKKSSSDPLSWDDLSKMKYTWRVVTETLRMHPPVMFSFRQVLQDIEMEGCVIPKGWQVFWAGCMTQLDESIYPDPHKFDPSRYEKPGAMPPQTFIPFGGGPRMCAGYEFARIEILTMLHYLVTGFKWKLCLEKNTISRDPMPVFEQGLPIQVEMKNPSECIM